MTSIDKKYSHLTNDERNVIEDMLKNGSSIIDISKTLGRDKSGISKEIKKHREYKEPNSFNNQNNMCIHSRECKKFDCDSCMNCYDSICPKLKKSPYVCNGCDKKSHCKFIKCYYVSRTAQNSYEDLRSTSRSGVRISKEEEKEIEQIIYPLIKEKNQSINEIYINNPDALSFSKQTLYSYIDQGLFHLKNQDLRRKIRYKYSDKKSKRTRLESKIRIGRKYSDFLEFITKHPNMSIVEMDTVEGVKGGKVFLTLYFRSTHLMLIHLLESKTKEEVIKVFQMLKETLGKDLFKKLFRIILTDNGSEFFDPDSIERINEKKEINLFYCDPGKSYQKGGIERNHEYIRYVLTKGSTFDYLLQDDVNLLMNNINNCVRAKLKNKSPYTSFKEKFGEDVLNKLNNYYIKPNDVNLSKKLLVNHKSNKKTLMKLIADLEHYYQRNDSIVFDNKFKIAIINYFLKDLNNYYDQESLFISARNAIDKGLIDKQ